MCVCIFLGFLLLYLLFAPCLSLFTFSTIQWLILQNSRREWENERLQYSRKGRTRDWVACSLLFFISETCTCDVRHHMKYLYSASAYIIFTFDTLSNTSHIIPIHISAMATGTKKHEERERETSQNPLNNLFYRKNSYIKSMGPYVFYFGSSGINKLFLFSSNEFLSSSRYLC